MLRALRSLFFKRYIYYLVNAAAAAAVSQWHQNSHWEPSFYFLSDSKAKDHEAQLCNKHTCTRVRIKIRST